MIFARGRLVRRKRGVAAIFSAIILFAMIATALLGYIVFINNSNLLASQANQARQNQNQAGSQERLSLAVYRVSGGSHNNWLWVEAYNTGGVPVTIIAVSVTNSAGHFVSNSNTSSKSPYLVGQPDLNVSLPLTLGAGVNTTAMTGCTTGKGCSIGINPAALPGYTSGTTVLVNVLTSTGNVFATPYPKVARTATVSGTTTSSQSSTTTAVTTAAGTSTVTQTTSTTIACSNCGTTTIVGQGTPSLVASFSACPLAGCSSSKYLLNGGAITLTGNVTNRYTQTITGVQIVIAPVSGIPTGTAYVTRNGVCTPSSVNLAAGQSALFSCQYTGFSGSSGGSITFAGYAIGTYLASKTTSAEATSNPLQIGNVVNTGPWSQSYFTYNFESSEQLTPSSADYVSVGNDHVSYTLNVRNDFNGSLTILDETFLIMMRKGADPTFFVAQNVCYPGQTGCGASPALTSYSCYSGSSMTGCRTVGVGANTTLIFAACPPTSASSPGSTSWVWVNSGGGGGCGQTWTPVEGDSVIAVIFYTIGSTTSGTVYAQALPFQSEILTYSDSLAVSCTPSPILVGSTTTCTATVTSTTGSVSPSGTIQFTTSPTSGAFSPISGVCTLTTVSGTVAKCSLTFTPSAPATYVISASYAGDTSHGPASGVTNVLAGYTATFDSPTIRGAADVSSATTVLTVTVGGTGSTCTGGSATAVTKSMLGTSGYSTAILASGTQLCYSYSTVASTTGGKQYAWSATSGTGSAAGLATQSGSFALGAMSSASATYTAQYQVTFAQSGLDGTATGTIVTVNGNTEAYANLPYVAWVTSGQTVTFSWTSPTVPSSVTNERFAFSASSQSSPYTVSSAVTITGTYKEQLQNTFSASPDARATWDVATSITITGTVLGTSGSTICTISTANGGGAAVCSGWADYNTASSFSPTIVTVSGSERWQAYGTSSFTDTTGGNTHSVNYYDQLQNTYKATPQAPATWDAVYSIPVIGTVGGATGTTGCTITTSSGGGAVSCASWFDYNTIVTVTSPLTSGSERWIAAGVNTFTQTTGGNTNNVNYYRQYQNTYQATPSARTTWDTGTSIPITGTYLGTTGSTICTITISSGGGAVSCSGFADYNTQASFSVTSISISGNERWMSSGAISFADTTGGNTHNVNFYNQLQNSYKSTPNGRATWDVVQTLTISGIQLGAAANICTVATASGGGAVTCTGWADYNSLASYSPITISVSSNERWSAATPTSFTDTTGGNTHNVNYWDTLQNTYGVVTLGTGPPTWDAGLSFTFTGEVAGATGSTICIVAPTSGGTATATCAGWADYNTAVSAPTNPAGQGASIRWQVSGTSTFTQTTAGNTNNVNYYKQLQNTYQATPLARTIWDTATAMTVKGTSFGTAGQTICTFTTVSGGGIISCSGWTDYNTAASMTPTSISVSTNERWQSSGASSWTQTTGGNVNNLNFYDQLQNTYEATPTSPATWDAAYSITVTGTATGTTGTTGCTIAAAKGGGAATCTGWFDYNTVVTVTSPVVSGSDRWAASGTNTFTQTTGGNTNNVNYARSFGLDPNTSSYNIARAASGTAATTLTISTTNTNDLIFACEYTVDTGITQTISAAGLTWTPAGTSSITTNHGEVTCWYATAASAFSGGKSISFGTSSSTSGGKVVLALAVTGNSLALDGSAVFATGSSGLSSSVGLTTANAPDLIVGAVFTASSQTSFTKGGSYGLISSVVTGPSGADEDLLVSASGSQTVAFSWSSTSSYWISVGLAIDPPAASAPQGSPLSLSTSDANPTASLGAHLLGFGILAALLDQPRFGATERWGVNSDRIGKKEIRPTASAAFGPASQPAEQVRPNSRKGDVSWDE